MDEARTGNSNKSCQGRRSAKSVTQQFNTARKTLRDRLKSGNMCKARLGRKPLLTAALEKELADHVLLLAKIFFGMTQSEQTELR
jgi:hypothetical protein